MAALLRATLGLLHEPTALGLLFVSCLAGCSAESDTPSTTSDASASADVRGDGAASDDFVGCPAGVPVAGTGLSARGQRLAANVIATAPTELERYINGWTVELRAPDGSPARGAQVVRAQTFMPLHGHDGGVVPRITPLADPGRSQVDRLNFIMRGPWEVRLWLRTEAGDDDNVTFSVCVAR